MMLKRDKKEEEEGKKPLCCNYCCLVAAWNAGRCKIPSNRNCSRLGVCCCCRVPVWGWSQTTLLNQVIPWVLLVLRYTEPAKSNMGLISHWVTPIILYQNSLWISTVHILSKRWSQSLSQNALPPGLSWLSARVFVWVGPSAFCRNNFKCPKEPRPNLPNVLRFYDQIGHRLSVFLS
jgi:hypothetical protein